MTVHRKGIESCMTKVNKISFCMFVDQYRNLGNVNIVTTVFFFFGNN